MFLFQYFFYNTSSMLKRLSLLLLFFLIFIVYFAHKWKCRINIKSIFDGVGDNSFENLMINFIKGLISYFNPAESDIS